MTMNYHHHSLPRPSPYALMHFPPTHPHQKHFLLQQQHPNFMNSWTLHRSPPEAMATHYLNILEEETDEGLSSHGAASTSPLIMIPSNHLPPFDKNNHHQPHQHGHGQHRFLPNGDILPQNRFRSLNRPTTTTKQQLGIQQTHNNFISGRPTTTQNNNNFAASTTKKFSRSEWDLRTEHGLPMPPNANLAYTSSSGQSPATSVVESGHSADEQHSDENFVALNNNHQLHGIIEGGGGNGGFFRSQRHHGGHYFSNTDLFAQPNSIGFNYLKYAKASDFESINTNAPHIKISDLFFELDPRSSFDRAMFRSNNPVPLIRGISFELFGGDTLALMYTSESELQCFIRILTNFDLPRGKISGNFEINGHRLNAASQFSERVAFVSNESVPKWLTVLEYLDYYSQFQKPSTNAVPRRRMITQLIHGLALGPLKHRLCKDLSFTEQQRLKLAGKMLLDSDILIADNILSEMDLYDSAFVIDFIRDWAQRFSRIVIISGIPSTLELLTMFRKTAIMASGRLIYFGESSEMCNYFQSIGFPSPSFKNPCDYYVDLVTLDYLTSDSAFESSTRIRTLGDIWVQKQPSEQLSPSHSTMISPKILKPSIFSQFFILYLRFWTIFFNRPWPRLGELFISAVFSLCLGWIYYDLPRSRRSGIDDREGFLFSLLCLMTFILAVLSQERIFEDRKMVSHDSKLKLYSNFAYLIAKIFFDLPFAIFIGASLGSPAYFLVHLNPIIEDNVFVFLSFLIPIILNLLIFRYFAWIFAFVFKPKLAVYTITLTIFSLISILSGFIIHESDQWKPFGIITLQKYVPQNLFGKEMLQLIYLNGNGSNNIYSMVNEIFGSQQQQLQNLKQKLPEFTIDCLKRSIAVPKLAEQKVLIVQQCLKTSGKQAFAFSSFFHSSTLDDFFWFIIGGWFIIILIILLIIISFCKPKYVTNHFSRR